MIIIRGPIELNNRSFLVYNNKLNKSNGKKKKLFK